MGLLAIVLAAVGAAVDGPCVAVSIEPLAFFVERIAGPDVCVSVLVGPGQSPHTYEPAPKQVAAVSSAKVFFGVGMPFERRVVGKVAAANRLLRVLDAAAGIERRRIDAHDAHENDAHGDDAHGEHEGGLDPHVWLSPANAAVIAKNTAAALKELEPGRADFFEKNLQALLLELEALDARIREILAPFKGRTVYVYHPAFGYFTDAYGLKQEPVEVSGKEPTARELAEFIEQAKREGMRVIFVQKQFPGRAAESVAKEVGGAVVRIDPLSRDYIANLEDIARKMAEAWQRE